MTRRPLLLALRLLPLRQDAAMFSHHFPNHRAERAPSAVELWAKCEAKSPTMAADLLTHSRRRTKRGNRCAAFLVLAVTLVFATYWLR